MSAKKKKDSMSRYVTLQHCLDMMDSLKIQLSKIERAIIKQNGYIEEAHEALFGKHESGEIKGGLIHMVKGLQENSKRERKIVDRILQIVLAIGTSVITAWIISRFI